MYILKHGFTLAGKNWMVTVTGEDIQLVIKVLAGFVIGLILGRVL